MYLAWRNGLDISGDGKLCFGEFCQACRNNDFRGHNEFDFVVAQPTH